MPREGERPATSGPDRLAVTRGGGCMILFGLPFFLAGAAIVFMTLIGQMRSPDPVALPFMLLFGSLFSCAGACLMFGRAGVIFDRRTGQATKWWGLLVPFSTETRPLSDLQIVLISSEIRRSKNSTYTVYPVRVETCKDRLNLREFQDCMQARRQAEEVAKFLGLGIRDSSSGTILVREAGTLDDSLRHQALKSGRAAEAPSPPPDCTIQYDVAGDEVAFDLPATGFKLGHLLPVMGGMLVSGFFAFFIFGALADSAPRTPGGGAPTLDPVLAVLGIVFVSLPLVAVAVGIFIAARTRERIVASPRVLRVVRRTPLWQSVSEIPAGRIEEFFRVAPQASNGILFGTQGSLTARSDECVLSFGASLPSADLDWLHGMIHAVVTAPPGPGAQVSGM